MQNFDQNVSGDVETDFRSPALTTLEHVLSESPPRRNCLDC